MKYNYVITFQNISYAKNTNGFFCKSTGGVAKFRFWDRVPQVDPEIKKPANIY